MSTSTPPVHNETRPGGGSASLATPERLSPRQRTRRAIALVVLTVFIPGLAQVVAGNRRLGRFALRIWLSSLIALAVGALLFVVAPSFMLGLLARSWVLFLLEFLALGLAVLWVYLFIDTLRLVRVPLLPRRARGWVVGLTVVCLVLTGGGMVWMSRNLDAGRQLVSSVFGGNEAADAENGRYNILLLGGDSGADRVGTRPDSITLVSVDAETGKPVMFGFARDTENIHFRAGSTMAKLMPEGWACGDECLLNALYTWGWDHKSQFPSGTKDPGIVATTEAVEALSGLDIQYYVLIDLQGFRDLVDAVGGLTIDVKTRTPIGGGTSAVSGYIEPGRQTLDGYHALWYARSREGSNNYERMARQRCVMTAMLQQLSPTTVLTKFQGIASASSKVVKTNIPESQLGGLAELALKAKGQKITSVNFVPPLMKPWSYDPSFVTTKVADTIAASEAPPTSTTTKKPSSSSTSSSGSSSTSSGSSGSSTAQTDDLASVCSV